MRRMRALAAQVPHKRALTLLAASLTGTTALVAGLSGVNQGMGMMVPLGDSLQVRTVEVRGRAKQGIHQP